MLELRGRAAAIGVALAVGAAGPMGTAATAEAQDPPEPSDEIDVTHLTFPDGTPLDVPVEVNERGEVVALMIKDRLPHQVVRWHDGEAQYVTPEEAILILSAVPSDQGQVVGAMTRDPAAVVPFWWADGEFAELPIPEGMTYGGATAINDGGLTVGVVATATLEYGLAAWQDGKIVVSTPGAADVLSVPEGISNQGLAAVTTLTGLYGEGDIRAAVWDVQEDELVDLGTLGGDRSEVVTITKHQGIVLVNSTNAEGDERAFVWHNGNKVDLGTLGGGYTRANAINEWGQVVGVSEDADGERHGFIWYQGEMTKLDTLGGTGTGSGVEPFAVNNWGQVVGEAQDPDGVPQAFLWQNGRIGNLSEATGVNADRAHDINDKGQIIGEHANWPDGRGDVFLWEASPLWGYPDGL